EGTAPEGTIITIYDDVLGFLGTTIVESGRWSFTPNPLNEGEYNLRVTYRDPVGNTTAPSDPAWTIIVDVTAPNVPVLTGIEDSEGQPITGGITSEPNPIFKGTADPAEAGATIELRDENGVLLGTGVVGTDGRWEAVVNPALGEGEHAISVGIKDAAGNTAVTPPVNLEVDLTAPELPGDGNVGMPGDALEGAWDNVEPQTGWINPDVATNDARPEFRGAGL
ncbi:Biofilm associated protein A, partial [Pantoea sp. B9002]|uniref:Ig-like domain-containing protein n=1 Tax=Pantoea sp. B9002 TaxID=2726979 RepID=UPI0017C045CD